MIGSQQWLLNASNQQIQQFFKHYSQGNEGLTNVKDNRNAVKDPYKSYPYNCIVRIASYFPLKGADNKNAYKQGTGFLIHNRLVITSAHLIYMTQEKIFAHQVFIYSQNQNNKEIKIKVLKYISHPEYSKNNNQAYDIALFIIEENQSTKRRAMQQLNIRWNYQLNKFRENNIHIAGYSGDKNVKNQTPFLYFQQMPAYCQRESILFYKHTTSQGNSGGPIFCIEKQNNKLFYSLIGIHKGYYAGISNYGILLSSKTSIFLILQYFKQQLTCQQNRFLNDQEKQQILFFLEKQILYNQNQNFQDLKGGNKQNKYPPQKISSTKYLQKFLQGENNKWRLTKNNSQTLQKWKKSNNITLNMNLSSLEHLGIKINMKQFIKYDWSQVQFANLMNCGINNQEWKIFVSNQFEMKNLKILWIGVNDISQISQNDFNGFHNLQLIDFGKNNFSNPLNSTSKQSLQKLKIKHPKMQIQYKI